MDGWLDEQESILALCASVSLSSVVAILASLSSRVAARFLAVVEAVVFRTSTERPPPTRR